ncbi:apoptosis regulator BAX-like [Centroberyx affinis]|uniref:apoptosis regulator BAX-like n=1 Tax=Centroberyx affinis TaxID=166261 RepID=UPI003A5B96F6
MASPTGGGNGKDQILGTALLKDFIFERVRRHGDSNAVVTRAQLGGGELRDPNHKKLAMCLQNIGNELDGNEELQRMINDSALSPTKEVFMKVAVEIFSDGKFNWGRVVALFYFASRLAIKAVENQNVNWIREQGGWERIRSHFGSSTWQTLGIFSAGVLTTFLVTERS